jgi:hypothetical protein
MEIDERTQQAMLYKDLESLIQRYYDEFDMTYESILGVLFRRLVLTVLEDIETDEDEEFTEEDD